jgi:regulator of replication initiation timing|tara:strand:- start:372 stop:1961 length:1590 start_codon:yes stop_codon:yes gene_type:complete
MQGHWEERISKLEHQLAALQEQNAALQEQNAALLEDNHRLREANQTLKDEVARLKKQKGKPKISPSRLLDKGKRKKRKKRERGKKQKPKVDRVEVVQPENVPEGSVFKGFKDYTVQELVVEARTTQYRCGTWLTPDGKLLRGELPPEASAGHFGTKLQSFILYQYYHAQVTEPLIVEQLREWGVVISTGQVHRLITEGKEKFHAEKDEILRVGLRVSGHIHVDDTGARHQGKNGYATHIGNDWFAWFQTTASKSRINFLTLLNAGHTDYVLSGVALEYMAAQKLPKSSLSKLASLGHEVYADERAWQRALISVGISKPHHIRIATEGALLGAALEHGLNPQLAIVSDDAGQFNILCHALCWIHAERILAKLVGFNDSQRQALEEIRTAVWQLYRDLKDYRDSPTPEAKRTLAARFDALCATNTCFTSLNLALKRMQKNKFELLMVLERPDLPLHNNLSEGDIREYVKRRKISGGTRSEAGRRGRDTFASLKKTARKLGVSFWDYLNDRIRNQGTIPPLPQLIEARAQAP